MIISTIFKKETLITQIAQLLLEINLHFEKIIYNIFAISEKRQKFDNGEDPLDAEEQAQQNQGFNPFTNFRHGGGNFRHGGFKFNFG